MCLIAKIGDSFLTEIGEYRLTLQWLILPDPNMNLHLLLCNGKNLSNVSKPGSIYPYNTIITANQLYQNYFGTSPAREPSAADHLFLFYFHRG